MMDVVEATTAYEDWLARHCELHHPDLEYKHDQMADPEDPFRYFRGTYYRWATLWPTACPDEAAAPRVLAVGDLHPENFATWRDEDGRLCWGVNDFDEADELPYTNDLIRLAAGVRIAKKGGYLVVKFGWACRAILAGYRETLEAGGVPFVLEERHPELRAVAMASERDPVKFWKKLTAVLSDPPADPPDGVRAALSGTFPAAGLAPDWRFRARVGMGSLGKPRYVALAEWAGGWIAREAKAVTPPATAWATDRAGATSRAAAAVGQAIRCPDPFYHPGPEWVTRRLAPRCSRIEVETLASAEDVLRVLWAMGAEAANVHIGTPGAVDAILQDLSTRPRKWLPTAARAASKAILQDWQAWRTNRPGQ
jgi:hypothetical protein